ncbi:MAG TPA: hypothetical protein VMI32_07085 [Candidatus Solibacter sp.]|nr:hypothetical protein [Candidatus Solibacter sp.]
MKAIRSAIAILMCAALLVVPALTDATGIVGTVANVTMSYTVGESIAVSGVPPSFSFLGSTPTFTGLAVTTTWNVNSSRTHVDMAMYVSSATQAMSDGAGHYITSAEIFQQKNGAGYLACTKPNTYVPTELQATVVTGATCAGQTNVTVTGANLAGTQTDTFDFQLQGIPGNQPAGSYTGLLNLVAGAA